MKKFFLLASVAVCFAACSSENEVIEEPVVSEITRSTCWDGSGNYVPCSKRGAECKFYQEGRTELDHYHCTTYWGGTKENPQVTCPMFYDYFLDIVDAWNHCLQDTPGCHGGASYYE